MVSPIVTELPRNLEPAGDDTFVRDLDARTVPRRPTERWFERGPAGHSDRRRQAPERFET